MEENSTNSNQPPPSNQTPATLDYRTPEKPAPYPAALLTWGVIIGLVCMGVAVPLGVLWSISWNWAAAFWLCAGGVAVIINASALVIYRKREKPPLAIGLWIGFGVALLINGACFAVLSRGFR